MALSPAASETSEVSCCPLMVVILLAQVATILAVEETVTGNDVLCGAGSFYLGVDPSLVKGTVRSRKLSSHHRGIGWASVG